MNREKSFSYAFPALDEWFSGRYKVRLADKTPVPITELHEDYLRYTVEHGKRPEKKRALVQYLRKYRQVLVQRHRGVDQYAVGIIRKAEIASKVKAAATPTAKTVRRTPVEHQTIQAIETRYKGYRFRSRLEARWAVFFDYLGMEWQYEPQGFMLSNGVAYLPDFWVPLESDASRGYWVEIKPKPLTAEEHEKCRLLAVESGHNVCVLAGEIWPGKFLQQKWTFDDRFFDFTKTNGDQYLKEYIAYPCGASGTCNMDFTGAYAAARSARFEHGEKGAA